MQIIDPQTTITIHPAIPEINCNKIHIWHTTCASECSNLNITKSRVKPVIATANREEEALDKDASSPAVF